MKTIGMLGGMSWESTSSYYQKINQGVREKLGDLHSAKICLYSVDFQEIEQLQQLGDWPATAEILSKAAIAVEKGGADCLVICTNTMHKVAPEIAASISIPILHIADMTAEVLKQDGIKRVGLLGTRYTMEQDFYKKRIADKFGIEVLVPKLEQRNDIHDIIIDELCLGKIVESSRGKYIQAINDLFTQGAEAVILGCTEIALLVQQEHTAVPLYDTTAIHADAAVRYCLAD